MRNAGCCSTSPAHTRDGSPTRTPWCRLAEIEAHLDDTWFSWYGGFGESDPFYYRVHSPVTLIEFDHHDGVVFDNIDPSRHHIHMLVRTPNGGDYGRDLLSEHHERFAHVGGRHLPR